MTNEELKKAEEHIWGNIIPQLGADIPTEEEFNIIADRSREIFNLSAPILGLPKLSNEEYGKILASIRENVTVKMEGVQSLIEDDEEHQAWLYKIKDQTEWFFWNRYSNYLIRDKKWSPVIVASLNETSDKIIDLLGDPKSAKNFARRGLIIGEVQSGKTANYTAICNKAADVGYNVIIVLTGMLEDLRRQTQERLDWEFAGRKSQVFLEDAKTASVKYQPIGVSKYGTKCRIPQFTSTVKDFSKTILLAQNLDIRDLNGTILFVVKKNKNILKNLADYLENSIDSGKKQIERSLLLIDDEADNASINTNKVDEDPTAINRCIREILSKFHKTTYVGITATPFANIFINPESTEEMLGNDLFPKDFIYALDVPQNYIGPSAIFGDNGKYQNMLVEIEPEDNPDIEDFIPRKHRANFQVNGLPPSLYEAMNYFLLVNVVRDLTDDKNTHRTMLIHVSRIIDVQEQVYRLVSAWLYRVLMDLRNYSALPVAEADKNSKYIAELHKFFIKYKFDKLSGLDWENFLHNYLLKAVEHVKAGIRNSRAKDSFNYADHPEGLRIIAIGGNSFSRGLTLEGLCVTYFYRHSQTYDTLMQMGRWFGYRPHYDNLCKIWTSSEIMDWYGYITDVSNELREEISIMQKYKMTPKDFGLKVRQHPGTLMITAKNKMRSGVPIKRPVGLDKIFLETPRLTDDHEILNANKNLILDFVKSLGNLPPVENAKNRNSWSGVPKEKIAELIFKFQTAPWHLAFQSQPIGEYILNKMDNKNWDVIIPEGDGEIYSEIKVGDTAINVKPIIRKISVSEHQVKIGGQKMRVGRTGAVRDTLSEEEIRQAENEYTSIKGNKNIKNFPDRAYMIYGRNPLLVLYVIEPKNKTADVPDILFALGVGFPARSKYSRNSKIETADYVANITAVEKFKFNDFDDDDDEDIEE